VSSLYIASAQYDTMSVRIGRLIRKQDNGYQTKKTVK